MSRHQHIICISCCKLYKHGPTSAQCTVKWQADIGLLSVHYQLSAMFRQQTNIGLSSAHHGLFAWIRCQADIALLWARHWLNAVCGRQADVGPVPAVVVVTTPFVMLGVLSLMPHFMQILHQQLHSLPPALCNLFVVIYLLFYFCSEISATLFSILEVN